MILSIQIVNYNSRNNLKNCLSSLKPFLSENDGKAEVIVINNDADPVGNVLSDLPLSNEGLKTIEINENIGFGKAHNKGFLKGSGDYVLFLNPDTEVTAESVSNMIKIFEADKRVGIIGPSLIDLEGKIQKDCYGFKKTPLSTLKSKLPKTKKISQNKEYFEVDWVSGGAMMIRSGLFSTLGGFDEKYFMYFEDVDLCLQAKKRGWKVIACSDIKVRHQSGKSFSSNKEKKKYYYESQNYYLKKNFGSWQARSIKILRLPLYIKNIYFSKW